MCGGHSPGSAGAVTQVCSPVPLAGAPNIAHFTDPLVEATIMVYSTITSQLLPTPAKSHYTFNLRDLSKVFQGMLMADPAKVEVRTGGPPPQVSSSECPHCPHGPPRTPVLGLPDQLLSLDLVRPCGWGQNFASAGAKPPGASCS